LNLEGEKISTSRNWAVWLHEYLEDFPNKQDVLRYVLTAIAPETKDNDFTWKDFQTRNNNELVGVLGNFINRVLILTQKYFDNKVPPRGSLTDYDKKTLEELGNLRKAVERNLDNFRFREAQQAAMNFAHLGNKYLAETEPWKTIKTDIDRTASILNTALQLVANLSIVFEPFLPFSAEKIRRFLRIETVSWNRLGDTDILPVGHELGQSELLFEKIEDDVIENQIQRLLNIKKANEAKTYKAKPIKETIPFEIFEKLDIRVGTVLECEKVPKSDKLLRFVLDDGSETRTILAGVAKWYPHPEKLIGKQVCFIANLEPKKMRGIMSEGMILLAENADGSLVFIEPSKNVLPGSRVL
jgi:methionyl-tRNA synthetase